MTIRVLEFTYFPEKFDPNFMLYRSDTKELYTVGGTFDAPVFNKVGSGPDTHKFITNEIWLAIDGLGGERLFQVTLDLNGLANSTLSVFEDGVFKEKISNGATPVANSKTLIAIASDKVEVIGNNNYDPVGLTYIQAFDPDPESPAADGLTFNIDGTKMYTVEQQLNKIIEWTLSTPWDVSTATETNTVDISTTDANMQSIAISDDGTSLWAGGLENDKIYKWPLSTPFDISTMGTISSFLISGQSPRALFLNADGTSFYTADATNTIKQWNMSTPFDVTTAVAQTNYVPPVGTNKEGIWLNPGGSVMLLADKVTDTVYKYSLSTPGKISTATSVSNQSITTETDNPQNIFASRDGHKFYAIDVAGHIDEYDFATPAGSLLALVSQTTVV